MAKIDAFLKFARDRGASDLHLSVGSVPALRIAGELEPIKWRTLTSKLNKELIYEILTERQIEKFEEDMDLDLSYELSDSKMRFRVNIFRGKFGVNAAFRLTPANILSLEQLGLPDQLKEFAQRNNGLVLVTGASGMGKSTTLAAIVERINTTRKAHIITIEDPIEHMHHNVRSIIDQREVGTHTKSFASALRAALREDPDVIMVGEMRDLETIELAVTAAETGHLVLATLHTNSAHQTVDRIVNVFPGGQQGQIRTMLAECLAGIVSQQLLKTADGMGRCAAIEILVGVPAIKNIIRENKPHQIPSIIQTSSDAGMQSMDDSVRSFLLSEKITEQEALDKAVDKKGMGNFIKTRMKKSI